MNYATKFAAQLKYQETKAEKSRVREDGYALAK